MERESEKKYGKNELDKIKKEIDRLSKITPIEIAQLEETMKTYRLGCICLSIALIISILCGGL